jgi:predicted O-linked N-acetylglucosamine transferase (SPINDLY family)
MAARAKRKNRASRRAAGRPRSISPDPVSSPQADITDDPFLDFAPPPAIPPTAVGTALGVTLVGALNEALECHRAGDLARAETLYRQVLEIAPDHANALHHIGLLHHQRGDHAQAIELIGRALQTMPDHAGAHSNLGAAYMASGQVKDAEACFRRAAELNPQFAEAHSNLAAALADLGRPDDAFAAYHAAHRAAPTVPRFIKRLADLYLQHEQYADAEEWFRRFLAMAEDDGEVNSNLGYTLERQGRLEEAETHYRKAAELCPESPEINNNLATLLVRLGRTDEAEPFFDRALRTSPDKWQDLLNLASSYVNRRDTDRALAILRQLVATQPDNARVYNDYGIALSVAYRPEEATPLFEKALALKDDYPEAWNNYGSNLIAVGRRPEAIDAFKKAIAHQPRYLEPHLNLCLALAFENRTDEAYLYAQAAVHLESFRQVHFSNPHKVFRGVCDFEAIEALGDLWDANEQMKVADFSANFLEMLVFTETEAEIDRLSRLHRRWYREVVRPTIQEPLPPIDAGRRSGPIRIGIMSSDLRNHSVAKFVLPVLNHYDRERFEIYCYSPTESPDDRIQALIRSQVKEFRVVREKSNRAFAELIRDDEIDILFELNGFTRDTKLKVLAYKPAPVQIYWLGYPFTTGIDEIDYILLDPNVKPVKDSWLVEKPLLMPESWVCFGSFGEEPISDKLPVERNGMITFGSLNNPYKLNRKLIALWSRVMQRVPNSRFLYVRPECRSLMLIANLTKEFERNGIARERLHFVNNRTLPISHLSYYDDIDITLDTWPLTGGTTTADTLWMGTPVISKFGPNMHQRLSYSMLKSVGLDQLCVQTDDEYVDLAVALANDLDSLRLLRRELRQSVRESALGRAEDYARAFCELMSELAIRHGLR